MVRRGYKAELRCKKELQKMYGKDAVLKMAIGSGEDFLVCFAGELLKVVEVKEIHSKKYYPDKREKEQFERIIKFAKSNFIPAELWIYQFSGRGKAVIKQIKFLYEVK